jgi:hypothetical protein
LIERGAKLKCKDCGYDHKEIKKHWKYIGEIKDEGLTYMILSNIYDGKILKEILDHALSVQNPPFDLFLDTCFVETHGCINCFLGYLKMGEDRRRKEQQFYDKGISIHEFF